MMRKYDDEFKQQAVRKILDGQSVASLSRELGIGESQLHKWKRLKIDSGSDLEKVRWSSFSGHKTLATPWFLIFNCFSNSIGL